MTGGRICLESISSFGMHLVMANFSCPKIRSKTQFITVENSRHQVLQDFSSRLYMAIFNLSWFISQRIKGEVHLLVFIIHPSSYPQQKSRYAM